MKIFILTILYLNFLHVTKTWSNIDREDFELDRVEILTLAPQTSVESLGGHSVLLLGDKDRPIEDGLVVELAADSEIDKHIGKLSYYTKGISGDFPLRINLLSARTYLFKNLVLERRDIKRTIIPLLSERKKVLWKKIMELQNNPELLGNYTFFKRNCASSIFWLFKKAGIPINYDQIFERSFKIGPKELSPLARISLLAPFPPADEYSLYTTYAQIVKKHKIRIRSFYDELNRSFKPFSPQDKEKLKKMSLRELAYVSQFLSTLDIPRSQFVRELISNLGNSRSVRFTSFKEFPSTFYEACDSQLCLSKLVKDMSNFYSSEELRKITIQNFQEYERTLQLHSPELEEARNSHKLQWKELVNALAETQGLKIRLK